MNMINPQATGVEDPNTATSYSTGEAETIPSDLDVNSLQPVDNAPALAAELAEKTPEEIAKEDAAQQAYKKAKDSSYLTPEEVAAIKAKEAEEKRKAAADKPLGTGGSASTQTAVAYNKVPEGVGLSNQLQGEVSALETRSMQALENAKDLERKAIEEREAQRLLEIRVEGKKNKELAELMAQHANDQKFAQEQLQNEVNLMQRGLDQTVKEYANARINPDFYRDRGTPQRIMGAIAIAMGTYASAMGAGPNVAMKIIDDAIARDLDIQQMEIAKKGNLINIQSNRIAQAMQLGLNQMEARKLVHASMLEGAKQDMQATLLQTRGSDEYSKLQIMQLQNTAEATSLQLKAQVLNSRVAPTIQKYGVIAQLQQQDMMKMTDEIRARAELAKKKQEGEFSFGKKRIRKDEFGNEYYAQTSKEAQVKGESALGLLHTAGALKDRLLARGVKDFGVGGNAERIMQDTAFMLEVRDMLLANSGALDKGVVEILQNIVPDNSQTFGWERRRQLWGALSGIVTSKAATNYKSAMQENDVGEEGYSPSAKSLLAKLSLEPTRKE